MCWLLFSPLLNILTIVLSTTQSLDDATIGAGGNVEAAPMLVLKDITVSIGPGEKVAICGRTGR